MVLGAILAVVTAASTRLLVVVVIAVGKAPVANLDKAIAALADTSASTMLPAVNATVDWLSSLSLAGVTVSPETKVLIGVRLMSAMVVFLRLN